MRSSYYRINPGYNISSIGSCIAKSGNCFSCLNLNKVQHLQTCQDSEESKDVEALHVEVNKDE